MKFDAVIQDKIMAVDDQWLFVDDAVWPEGVWAIHWDGTSGEIEYEDSLRENEEIKSLKDFEHLLTAYDDQKILRSTDNRSSEEKWKDIRRLRNAKLENTDWMLLDDAGLSIPQRQQVIAYRNELRDIPQTFANPDNVVWSDVPSIRRGK